MMFLNLLAAPIIGLLLGKQWLQAVPYLEILAFQGIAISLQGVNYNAIASIGHSKSLFQATVIKRSVSVVLLIIGMYVGGIKGILWGMTISSYFMCLYNSALVHKHVGYTLTRQLLDLLPIIIINTTSFLLAYTLKSLVKEEGLILYIGVFSTYALSYLFFSIVFKINTIEHLEGIVNKIRHR